jgi:hypothetical protein
MGPRCPDFCGSSRPGARHRLKKKSAFRHHCQENSLSFGSRSHHLPTIVHRGGRETAADLRDESRRVEPVIQTGKCITTMGRKCHTSRVRLIRRTTGRPPLPRTHVSLLLVERIGSIFRKSVERSDHLRSRRAATRSVICLRCFDQLQVSHLP